MMDMLGDLSCRDVRIRLVRQSAGPAVIAIAAVDGAAPEPALAVPAPGRSGTREPYPVSGCAR